MRKWKAATGWETTVTEELVQFLAERDEFYFATANAAGQPYVQYRGGRPGFLRVIDKHTLGFADFDGNQQYITLGNLSENSKAFIFLMDYIDLRRVKIWGTARVIDDDPALVERLHDRGGPSPPTSHRIRDRSLGHELSATYPPAVSAGDCRAVCGEAAGADSGSWRRS